MATVTSCIIVGILAFAGGYLACLWWGKPARILKQAAAKGIDVAKEITNKAK